jgi:hypothetical protein
MSPKIATKGRFSIPDAPTKDARLDGATDPVMGIQYCDCNPREPNNFHFP